MLHEMMEPPVTHDHSDELKGVYFFLYFEFEYRKSRTAKGIQYTSLNVQPSAQLIHKYVIRSLAMTTSSFFANLMLSSWCSSAAPEERQCRRAALPQLSHATAMT
jgi:hypothetical protein